MNKRVLEAVVRHSLAPIVVGKNPLDVGRIWDEMLHATYKLGTAGSQPEAMAGIDIALWDILGKTAGLPIHRCSAAAQGQGPALRDIGNGAQNPVADQVKKAVAAASQGYTAVKMRMEWSSRATDVNPARDWELLVSTRPQGAGRQARPLLRRQQRLLGRDRDIRLGRRFQDELNVLHYEEPDLAPRLRGLRQRISPRSTLPSPRASTSTRSGSSAT